MARGLVSAEGIGAFSYPCINGSSAEIVRGRPLMRKGLHTNEGQVIYGLGGMALGEFAGVLSEDLEYNGVADISSSKLKTHGKMRATVYVDGTPSTYIAGANLLPVVVSGVACFKRVVRSTGIRLLEDWTAKTASTMYKVEEMGGAKIFVEPGVSIHNGLLHYFWENPAVASATYYLSANASSNSVATTVLAAAMSNSATPDFARNVTITPGGTTASVAAGDYVISGVDIFGDTITDTITMLADASTIQTGTKCFARVTSLLIPIQDGAGATFSLGTGSKLALGRCFPAAPIVLQTRLGGTIEGTAPTLTADIDDIESNGATLNSALNGGNVEMILLAA